MTTFWRCLSLPCGCWGFACSLRGSNETAFAEIRGIALPPADFWRLLPLLVMVTEMFSDEYFKHSKKNMMFTEKFHVLGGFRGSPMLQERRGTDRRKHGVPDTGRRELRERREKELRIEHDKRKGERRQGERRSLEERRVTSNYSEERLQAERERLARKRNPFGFLSSDPKVRQRRLMGGVLLYWALLLSLLIWLLNGCSTKVSCGNETSSFFGIKFHSPIAQKCKERPNRATDIVGF